MAEGSPEEARYRPSDEHLAGVRQLAVGAALVTDMWRNGTFLPTVGVKPLTLAPAPPAPRHPPPIAVDAFHGEGLDSIPRKTVGIPRRGGSLAAGVPLGNSGRLRHEAPTRTEP